MVESAEIALAEETNVQQSKEEDWEEGCFKENYMVPHVCPVATGGWCKNYTRCKNMAKYRTKPCEIEAIQWIDNTKEIIDFCQGKADYSVNDTAWEVGKGQPSEKLVIHTLEGDMVASRNDYIIKGLRGEFYPCKTDVFEKKYELAE